MKSSSLRSLFDYARSLGLQSNEFYWLLDKTTAIKRTRAMLRLDSLRIEADAAARLRKSIDSICKDDKPIQYELGDVEWFEGELKLVTRPPTLIPRVETEHWVSKFADMIVMATKGERREHEPFRILDPCCGSGCVGLGLLHLLAKHKYGNVTVDFVDIKSAAIALARENCLASRPLSNVRFYHQSIFEFAPAQKYDVIACNPPYIPLREYETGLPRQVTKWEDRDALVGGGADDDDGFAFIGDFIRTVRQRGWLSDSRSGMMCVEIGSEKQGQMIVSQWGGGAVHKDQYGRDRFAVLHSASKQ